MDIVSVIVPIFNVDQCLEKCLDSIVNQSYRNIEIILVNDGSTDRSPEICWEYEKKDPRIRVISKPNGGLSSARNAGLDVATGEYIVFVDSDDFVERDMIQVLYEYIIREQADLAFCDFNWILEDGSSVYDRYPDQYSRPLYFNETSYTPAQMFKALSMPGSVQVVVAWNKLYKNELWKTLRYPEGMVHEDEYIIHHILGLCSKIAHVPYKGYNYVLRQGSITQSVSQFKILNLIESMIDRYKYYVENGYNEVMFSQGYKTIKLFYKVNLHVLDKEQKEYYKRLRKMYLDVFHKHILNKRQLKKLHTLIFIAYSMPHIAYLLGSFKDSEIKKRNSRQ